MHLPLRMFTAALLLQSLLPFAGLHAQEFTLQQAMSAPFNSELSAAPTGRRFAWVMDEEGRRNLWIAEPSASGYHSRPLTHYDADDGQQIDELAWTPDGESIAFTRGGDFEFPEKPFPNPALLPQGVEQQIWLISIKDGSQRLIADGRSPAFSPGGGTLAYLSKGQVWTVKWDDPAAKPAQMFFARGELGSLRWSPDGRRLAFVSGRGDHGFIGVYDIAAKHLTYLDPSTQSDSEPVWSPDSRRVAFIRIPPDESGITFKPRRTAQPWSIHAVDVSTGAATTIWRATPGQGSAFHELEGTNQLLWMADGRIVFPWEGDGWIHLYAVSSEGGSASLLTPGAFEVEDITSSPDHRRIVYASNQATTDPLDQDRRHLWSLDEPGGTPRQLTTGAGIEKNPILASDGSTLATLHADARLPVRPAIVASGELHDLAPQTIPAAFPAAKFAVPQQVIFSAADGTKIHGQLFLPPANQGRHAAVVFFHGGSRRQMLLGWNSMQYYSNAYAMNQYLASLGYIVLSVNYRSGIGYGLDFREALNYGAAGASEFNDVLGAGLYLRNRADVDPARIGVWGGSYGGYLTALALARASDLFAAGVDMHGVHDWNIELGNWQPSYNPNADQKAARLAWESSPLAYVSTWRSPVLLMQGDDDRNVQFSQTVKLAAALRAQGVPIEEHIFPDEIHDFLLHRTWVTAYQLEADFFNRKLGNQPRK